MGRCTCTASLLFGVLSKGVGVVRQGDVAPISVGRTFKGSIGGELGGGGNGNITFMTG